GRNILLWPAAVLACLVMLALGAGTPLLSASQKSDRLLWAFREHFAWNWGRWHHEWRDIFSVWEQEFGGAQSTLQAFATNPQAVLHHLCDNLLGTMRFVAVTTFDHYPVLVPATSPLLVKAESALLSLVAFGSLIVVASRPHLRRQMQERYGHALFVYVLLPIGSLASATVVFPLAYYLVIPGALLVLTGTLAASLLIPARRQFSTGERAVAALVCLMVVPRPFVLPSAYVVPGSPFKAQLIVARTTTDTITFIRSLGLTAPVHVLTLTDGIGEMLGTGFHEVKIWEKGTQPLDAYMRDNNIDVIINLEGGRNSLIVSDPY